jgi:hypothetical protein
MLEINTNWIGALLGIHSGFAVMITHIKYQRTNRKMLMNYD